MGSNVLFRLTNKEKFEQREPKQGEISFLSDTGEIYVDYNNRRVKYAEVNPQWDDLAYGAAPVNDDGNGGENNGGSEQGQQEQGNSRATPKDFLEYDENQCIIGLYPDTRLNDYDYSAGVWYPKCAYIEDDYALGVEDSAFKENDRIYKVKLQNARYIEHNAFCRCANLKSVELPNVTRIGSGAFYGYGGSSGVTKTKLNYISCPNVTRIEEETFATCIFLKSISFPNLTYLGSTAFSDCTILQTINLPSVTELGDINPFRFHMFAPSQELESTGRQIIVTSLTTDYISSKNWTFNGLSTEFICSDGTITLQ